MDLRRIAIACALAATPAYAQSGDDAVQRVERQLRELDQAARFELPGDAAFSERALLEWGGSIGFSLYSIDDAESKSHTLRQTDARAWMRAEIDGRHRFFARLKLRYDDWNTGDDFDGQGDDLREPLSERWWYEFDSADGAAAANGAWRIGAQLGKQHFEVGNGVALSATLIGVRATVARGGLELGVIAADTPVNDFIDFDASRPSFDTNTKRRFIGATLERRGGDVTPFAHVLRQTDRNDRDSTIFQDGLGQVYPTEFEYDSTYWGAGARGPLTPQSSWYAEFDVETGRALSSPITAVGTPGTQTHESIFGWAFAGGVAWSLEDARKSRIDGALIVASADDDRLDSADTFGGNTAGTIDRGFNGFGFLDTGLALAPDPGNLATLRVGLETSPFAGDARLERLRAVAAFYLFNKLDPDAPINVPTVRERFVGAELDLGFDWNVRPDVTLSFRYGAFMPGGAMPPEEDGTRQILFGGVTYAF